MDSDKRYFGDSVSWLPLWAHVAIGVAVGVLIANAVQAWAVRQYLEADLQKTSDAAAAYDANAAERARAERAAAAMREQRRIGNELATTQAADQARADAAAETERREQTWRKLYRPSPGCIGSVATVECANEHMRFKRDFDEKYNAGRLQ